MRATSGDGPLLEPEATRTRPPAAGWGSSTPLTLSGSNVISGLWPGAHRSASASVNVSGPATATTPPRRGLLDMTRPEPAGADVGLGSWRRLRQYRTTPLTPPQVLVRSNAAPAITGLRPRRRPVLRLEIGSAVARSVGLTELRTRDVVLRGQSRRVCNAFHAADGSVLPVPSAARYRELELARVEPVDDRVGDETL